MKFSLSSVFWVLITLSLALGWFVDHRRVSKIENQFASQADCEITSVRVLASWELLGQYFYKDGLDTEIQIKTVAIVTICDLAAYEPLFDRSSYGSDWHNSIDMANLILGRLDCETIEEFRSLALSLPTIDPDYDADEGIDIGPTLLFQRPEFTDSASDEYSRLDSFLERTRLIRRVSRPAPDPSMVVPWGD